MKILRLLLLLLFIFPVIPVHAQGGDSHRSPITPDNIDQLVQIAMLGHGTISDFAWSPNGNSIATVGSVGIWIYDAHDMNADPRLLAETPDAGTAIAYSPDGSLLAAGGWGEITVWDVTSGNITTHLQGFERDVQSIIFSPDGARLAAIGHESTVRLWNATTGEQLGSVSNPSGAYTDLDFNPDGSLLAISGSNNSIQIIDGTTAEQLRSLSAPTDGVFFSPVVRMLAFSSDGTTLISVSDATAEPVSSGSVIRFWDMATGDIFFERQDEQLNVVQILFGPDGQPQFMGSYDDTANAFPVFDAQTGKLITYSRPGLSPDGMWAASVINRGDLILRNLATGERWQTQCNNLEIYDLKFSPDGRRILIRTYTGIGILWEVETGKHVVLPSSVPLWSAEFSPNGTQLLSGTEDGYILTWDITRNIPIVTDSLKVSDHIIHTLVYSPDGQSWASIDAKGVLKVWDATTKKVIMQLIRRAWELEVHGTNNVRFSPDGRFLETISEGKIQILDLSGENQPRSLDGLQFGVDQFAFLPDSPNIVALSSQSRYGGYITYISVWDLTSDTLQTYWSKDDQLSPFWSPSFSLNGHVIAYAYSEGINLRDIQTGNELASLSLPTDQGLFAFSPDWSLLATNQPDGTIRLWGIPTE